MTSLYDGRVVERVQTPPLVVPKSDLRSLSSRRSSHNRQLLQVQLGLRCEGLLIGAMLRRQWPDDRLESCLRSTMRPIEEMVVAIMLGIA